MTDQMSDSILVTIKKMLGIEDDYSPFDTDIKIFINSALMNLTQLGVGPKEGFTISDYDETWSDFITNKIKLGAVKTYVYLKVKMMFDPPTNSFVMDAMKQQAEEIGWRLNVQAESVEKFDFMDESSLKRGGSPANIGIDEEPDDSGEDTPILKPDDKPEGIVATMGEDHTLEFGYGSSSGGGN